MICRWYLSVSTVSRTLLSSTRYRSEQDGLQHLPWNRRNHIFHLPASQALFLSGSPILAACLCIAPGSGGGCASACPCLRQNLPETSCRHRPLPHRCRSLSGDSDHISYSPLGRDTFISSSYWCSFSTPFNTHLYKRIVTFLESYSSSPHVALGSTAVSSGSTNSLLWMASARTAGKSLPGNPSCLWTGGTECRR